MEEPKILYAVENGVATITFNRPDKMNAISDEMLADLANVLAEATLDDGVRVLIVTGNGRAFCAGADVTAGVARDHAQAAAAEAGRRLQEISASEDAREGVRSFLERRPPIWKGR